MRNRQRIAFQLSGEWCNCSWNMGCSETLNQVLPPAWKYYSKQHLGASSHGMCKDVVVQSELRDLFSVKLSFYISMKYFDFSGLWDTQCLII